MKVVVTDCDFSDTAAEREVLEPGIEISLVQSRDPDQIADAASAADGLLVQYARIDGELMDRLPGLKAIVGYGIGLDNIDLDAARRHGVEVRNVPDYCIDEVSEHTLAMILQVSRRLIDFQRAASAHWSTDGVPVPRSVRKQTVGVLGMGRVGHRVASLAAAVGFQVIYHDPFAQDVPGEWRSEVALPDLAARADHLTLHLPLTDETNGLIDAGVLRHLGPDGHLVNTGRGGLVDEPALLETLNRGELGWASLDVLALEPPTGTSAKLLEHRRVLVTPHVAYLSQESLALLPRRAAEIMKELLGAT